MNLKDWRKRECITQAQAADRIGVTVTTVSRWEAGDVVPRKQQMAAIRKATKGAVGDADFVKQGGLLGGGAA